MQGATIAPTSVIEEPRACGVEAITATRIAAMAEADDPIRPIDA